jgi:hypothetical protein
MFASLSTNSRVTPSVITVGRTAGSLSGGRGFRSRRRISQSVFEITVGRYVDFVAPRRGRGDRKLRIPFLQHCAGWLGGARLPIPVRNVFAQVMQKVVVSTLFVALLTAAVFTAVALFAGLA